MQLSPNQGFNEALFKTGVLLDQVYGMVSLTEQDYLEEVIDDLKWQSPICRDAFLTQAIHEARVANDAGDAMGFLKSQSDDIVIDEAHKVVTTPAYMLASNLVEADAGISKLVAATLALI